MRYVQPQILDRLIRKATHLRDSGGEDFIEAALAEEIEPEDRLFARQWLIEQLQSDGSFDTIDSVVTELPPTSNSANDEWGEGTLQLPISDDQITRTTNNNKDTRGLPPERIDKFRIERELGRGGVGVVYLGFDDDLKRPVAIKVLLAADEVRSERLRLEAAKIAQLDSDGIVPIYQIGRMDDGSPYLVQKYICGSSLRSFVRDGGLSPADATRVVRDIALGLEPVHRQGVLHRDLKPENILVDMSGRVWIADFGLAMSDEDKPRRRRELAGTPSYMSPEQIQGHIDQLDARSDIWALGVMYYELLTGKLPFVGDSLPQLAAQVCERDPRPLQQRAPGHCTDAMNTVFLRCCAKATAERYATAKELANDLDRLIANGLSNKNLSGESTSILMSTAAGNVSTHNSDTSGSSEETLSGVLSWPPPEPAALPDSLDSDSSKSWSRWTLVATGACLLVVAIASSFLVSPDVAPSATNLEKQEYKPKRSGKAEEPPEEVQSANTTPPDGVTRVQIPVNDLFDFPAMDELLKQMSDALSDRNSLALSLRTLVSDERIVLVDRSLVQAWLDEAGESTLGHRTEAVERVGETIQNATQIAVNAGCDVPLAFQLAHGWELYYDHRLGNAVGEWLSTAVNANVREAISASERRRIASALLATIIENSGVADSQFDPLRYSTAHGTDIDAIIQVAFQLAGEQPAIRIQVFQEFLLLNLARGDLNRAERSLAQLQSLTKQNDRAVLEDPANGQMLRGQLECCLLRLEKADLTKDDRITTINRLLSLAIRTSDRATASDDGALVDVVTSVALIPTMKVLALELRNESALVPKLDRRFNQLQAASFCRRFVDSVSVIDPIRDYAKFTDWLKQIEFAAAVAAEHSPDTSTKNRMVRYAIEAAIQRRYESDESSLADDEHDTDEALSKLLSYQSLMVSTDPLSLDLAFVRGRMEDQLGFAERQKPEIMKHYSAALEAYIAAVLAAKSEGDDATEGEVRRCLAALKTRIALLEPDSYRILLEAKEEAQQCVELPQSWHRDMDDRLVVLAQLSRGCALFEPKTQASDDDRLQRLDQSISLFEQAVDVRMGSGRTATVVQIQKLASLNAKYELNRSESMQQQIQQFMNTMIDGSVAANSNSIVELANRDASANSHCSWQLAVAYFFDLSKNTSLAAQHIQRAKQIADESPSVSDAVKHDVGLTYCRYLQTEYGKPGTDRKATAEQVWTIIDSIDEPSPMVRRQRILTSLDWAVATNDTARIVAAVDDALSFHELSPQIDSSGLLADALLRAYIVRSTRPTADEATNRRLDEQMKQGKKQLTEAIGDLEKVTSRHSMYRDIAVAAIASLENDIETALSTTVGVLDELEKLDLAEPADALLMRRVQEFLLIPLCQRLKAQRRSIAVAKNQLKLLKTQVPEAARIVESLLK